LEAYEIGEVARLLYEFFWGEFCDWYIELVKPRLYGKDEAARALAQNVLVEVLGKSMQLLHPFMPFISEEIWQHLPGKRDSIMISPWPQPEAAWDDKEAEESMELVMAVIRAIRNLRSEMNVPPGRLAEVMLVTSDARSRQVLQQAASYVEVLATVQPLRFTTELQQAPAQAATAVTTGVQVFMPLAGLIDLEKEQARLEKELQSTRIELQKVEKKLANRDFRAKAPAAIVAKEEAKVAEMQATIATLSQRLSYLQG
jgi:valyl-tRNA synthetase